MAIKARLPTDMFRFTFGDRSEIYTAVLQVFGEANERLETALGLAEVSERLQRLGWVGALPEADLFDVLKQLKEWHLLDITQNHTGTYRTADEYERRNLLYSLTRNGEAAISGLEHAVAILASTGALQTAVLDAIADRLRELGRLLADPGSSDRRVFSAVQELEGHLEGLRVNTKQFNGQLQRLLRADGTDHETFHEVKAATVAYLQEFLTNLDLRARMIAPDRHALHTFFRERIEDARASNTAASWEQQLGEVFDYTAWHQFVVKVDRAKGAGWEVLTKKLHGALSGGEKAIALHLPLFAAIAAHYQAVLDSPRVILLDEVFVGVDAANRGQVFALLAALDLDLVLTSDHEWCTYRELDGIAIHQLATGEDDDDDAVTSVRFTWNGSRLLPETNPVTQ